MNILILLFTVFSLQAATLNDVTLPDQEQVGTKKLVLNGLGIRGVTVMSIPVKVYVGGLYLEKKAKDADEIINSTSSKKMKLHFLHHASKNDSKKAWTESFERNCDKKCDAIQEKIKAFKDILPDVDKNQTINYSFTDKTVELDLEGKSVGKVESPELVKLMLTSWLGKKPISEDLRDGLLGK
jgi:hypothetical protein